MNKWNKNIPEGTRDVIFDEAKLYSEITGKFTEVFTNSGFMQVRTPTIEYYDVFDYNGQAISQEDMYKLTDNNGRLIVLRADNTTPVARVVATKLKQARLPLKVFYNQHIYRLNSDYSGKRSEILQSGVEIIGAGGIKSDLVCISAALDALRSLDVNYKLEIGHVGYYNALVKELNLSEADTGMIRAYVDSKNAVSLNLMNISGDIEKIRKIPLLFGGEEVFAKAEQLAEGNSEALEALEYVKNVYSLLTLAGYGDRIMVDMGMVHKIDYYTGVVFGGYIEGVGEPVLQGGRYDNLLENFGFNAPATGFAVNVCSVADAWKNHRNPNEPSGCIIHFSPELYCKAEEIKNSIPKGELSCFDDINDTVSYAKQHNIKYIAVLNENGTEIKETSDL